MEAAEEELETARSFWHRTQMLVPRRLPKMILRWPGAKVRNRDWCHVDDDPEEDCSCAVAVESVCSTDEDRFDVAAGTVVVVAADAAVAVGSAGVGEGDDDAHCHHSRVTVLMCPQRRHHLDRS